MIFIIDDDENRLCHDGRWRSFACFGTYRSCVHTYRSLGHARRRARRIGGHAVVVPGGSSVDASGKCFVNDELRRDITLTDWIIKEKGKG